MYQMCCAINVLNLYYLLLLPLPFFSFQLCVFYVYSTESTYLIYLGITKSRTLIFATCVAALVESCVHLLVDFYIVNVITDNRLSQISQSHVNCVPIQVNHQLEVINRN